jgi:hypothetical protein
LTHVYLDNNATTPLDERVLEAMLPFMREHYGNASSRHELGTRARQAVNVAREQVRAGQRAAFAGRFHVGRHGSEQPVHQRRCGLSKAVADCRGRD